MTPNVTTLRKNEVFCKNIQNVIHREVKSITLPSEGIINK